jgi:hypothetical protein
MLSMCEGEMVLPPEVTIKSRARSTSLRQPSRRWPMSPVRIQPVVPSTASEASGLFQ